TDLHWPTGVKPLGFKQEKRRYCAKRDIVLFRSARKKNLWQLFAIWPNVDSDYSRWSTKKRSARRDQSRNACPPDADRVGSSRLRATQRADLKFSPQPPSPICVIGGD